MKTKTIKLEKNLTIFTYIFLFPIFSFWQITYILQGWAQIQSSGSFLWLLPAEISTVLSSSHGTFLTPWWTLYYGQVCLCVYMWTHQNHAAKCCVVDQVLFFTESLEPWSREFIHSKISINNWSQKKVIPYQSI